MPHILSQYTKSESDDRPADTGMGEEGSDRILEVSHLTVQRSGISILHDISFSLERGLTLAIVGPNGAGKTTLFRALLNLVPYSGRVTWSGKARIGYVPQSLVSTDIPMTVREFLALKRVTDTSEALRYSGLSGDMADRSISRLSGGQLQRVILAWAVADLPDVVLFDEPTSLVDIGAEEPIYERLREMKHRLGVTFLLISHNLHVVSHYSDRILGLNRDQRFFGDTASLSHSYLMELMTGSSQFGKG